MCMDDEGLNQAITSHFLNQTNKLCLADLKIDPSSFVINLLLFLKNNFSRAQGDSLPTWFIATFAALFVLNCLLREFPLSAIANHFEPWVHS